MKKNYQWQGKLVPGEEIEYEAEREGWNIYVLHDGTRMKVKVVVANIARLDTFNENGDPVYMLNASLVVNPDIPDGLKRK